jgi:hypothetical protein
MAAWFSLVALTCYRVAGLRLLRKEDAKDRGSCFYFLKGRTLVIF